MFRSSQGPGCSRWSLSSECWGLGVRVFLLEGVGDLRGVCLGLASGFGCRGGVE